MHCNITWQNMTFFTLLTTSSCCKLIVRDIVSWEPEGRYQYSKMFRWEPEGRHCCKKPMAIAPFWFSTEHGWTVLTPFWFSADDMYWTPGTTLTSCLKFHDAININIPTQHAGARLSQYTPGTPNSHPFESALEFHLMYFENLNIVMIYNFPNVTSVQGGVRFINPLKTNPEYNLAEQLEPRTSIPAVPGSSPGPAVAPLGKALYPHCLVFRRRL